MTNVAGSQPPNKLLDMHLTMGTFTAYDNNHSDAKIPQTTSITLLFVPQEKCEFHCQAGLAENTKMFKSSVVQ